MAGCNPKHHNVQDDMLRAIYVSVGNLWLTLIFSFELFLLSEGEKKIEEKVYSGKLTWGLPFDAISHHLVS